MKSLTEIGKSNWTEKVSHGYLDIYENLWRQYQDAPITFLEIGVYNGNSMRTWCDWFTNATIIGIDKHAQPKGNESCAKLYYGDQSDTEFLGRVCSEYNGFDIIVDDAGHKWDEQQACFTYLWPHINSNGQYIIEDLHTSADIFWGKEGQVNTIDFLKTFIDEVVLDSASTIKSVEFYNKLVVLHKK